jgi:hypothetical protein
MSSTAAVSSTAVPVKPKKFVAKYQYELTPEQQSSIQLYLRLALTPEQQEYPEWKLLHDLTYTRNWGGSELTNTATCFQPGAEAEA